MHIKNMESVVFVDCLLCVPDRQTDSRNIHLVLDKNQICASKKIKTVHVLPSAAPSLRVGLNST